MQTHSTITHTASQLTHKCCETQDCVRSLHCSRDFRFLEDLNFEAFILESYVHEHKHATQATKATNTHDQIRVCIYCLAGWQHGAGQ